MFYVKLNFVKALFVKNLLFLNKIESNDFNLHENILIKPKNNKIRYYKIMKSRLQLINI